MKNQLAPTIADAETIIQWTIHMDQIVFTAMARMDELERIVRQKLRTRYARTDSSVVLMMGSTQMSQAQIVKGLRQVDVITKGLGASPDPPDTTAGNVQGNPDPRSTT
jgi:hypothetical protein